jgi:hypothetical protein
VGDSGATAVREEDRRSDRRPERALPRWREIRGDRGRPAAARDLEDIASFFASA